MGDRDWERWCIITEKLISGHTDIANFTIWGHQTTKLLEKLVTEQAI